MLPRHCEERRDEAIQGDRTAGAAALDCRAAKRRLAMTKEKRPSSDA
jgi:hypothetical protein